MRAIASSGRSQLSGETIGSGRDDFNLHQITAQ
jgi:hypothetical protein